MAQALLVRDHLTTEMISAGSLIIKALDSAKVLLKAAFWQYLADERTWRLFLVSPQVRTLGPKAVYRKVSAALDELPVETLRPTTSDISVLDDKSAAYSRVRSLVSNDATIAGARLVRSSTEGRLLDDVYVYRAN
jgi:hypothetical protein